MLSITRNSYWLTDIPVPRFIFGRGLSFSLGSVTAPFSIAGFLFRAMATIWSEVRVWDETFFPNIGFTDSDRSVAALKSDYFVFIRVDWVVVSANLPNFRLELLLNGASLHTRDRCRWPSAMVRLRCFISLGRYFRSEIPLFGLFLIRDFKDINGDLYVPSSCCYLTIWSNVLSKTA